MDRDDLEELIDKRIKEERKALIIIITIIMMVSLFIFLILAKLILSDISTVGIPNGYAIRGDGGLAGAYFTNNGSDDNSGSYSLLTGAGNVGINVSNPTSQLEVWGNINTTSLQLVPNGSPPTCNATTRGMLWVTQGALGVADTFNVYQKSVLDVYNWNIK